MSARAKTVEKRTWYNIVRVDWLDSCATSRWTPIDHLSDPSGAECVTVGFLMKENKTAISVAQSLSPASADHIMEIPRACIRKITPWRGRK